jgi:hypothetical protein
MTPLLASSGPQTLRPIASDYICPVYNNLYCQKLSRLRVYFEYGQPGYIVYDCLYKKYSTDIKAIKNSLESQVTDNNSGKEES